MRHNRIQPLLQYGCVALRMRFFPQNFGTIKRILPGSSSPSHREGPGTEVGQTGGQFVCADRKKRAHFFSKFHFRMEKQKCQLLLNIFVLYSQI